MTIIQFNKRQTVVIVGIAAVVATLGFVAFRMGPLAPTKVTVTQVSSEGLTPSVFGIGSVEARQSWLLGPAVAGRVLHVHVDVGQAVKAGQLLAEMDPVDLGQRLQAQEAALSKAVSIEAAAHAQVADAKARRELVTTTLNRQKELAQQNFISPSALEGREQELQSADAVLAVAQANLQAAKQDAQRQRSERAAVSLQKQNTRLMAPADAVVISRDAESGSTVVAGQPVLRLVNPASLWVKLRVDQARSTGLAVGLPAQIVLRSRPQQVLAGKVDRVELQADAVTEERIAQVAFEQIPASLSIGEMAEVTLQLQPTGQALVVPQASVQTYQGRTGVWRLKDGTLDFVPVQWGATSLDGRVQALSGLSSGDTVVVYNEKPLSAGGSFKVVDALVKKARP
ncbi:MAG: efflux transporter periplasmic adaptor subunit [Curvibacter sp. RIFCSPHIGHO2_12_FULL_63_18]|uniref:efflux RND transporter periplasmic adaptor subunit n=1 Tax=Rhodoferax sp. TaxID=50421 RepID=UPI0008CD297B|nr:efflux RND transporter periplasmic adaptor subunit [Rhodoferax sp.]OGO97625.1 MAG: efflux transporter periplasmic adaptor subunit [Curvibacter sp. GWA2_63_95]OGP04076.1 MAG: efflux transporter periplasmic adaptor subunit [Curvibacter sp. RIFCSPHIGHO2_12_FULL_63_18]HCX82392.1 efflux transporter periplasmic adaptor subunit [Rhodoferax sp.]